MTQAHTFHIPVMGIGFTVDTPLKVSQYGIDSVISLVDDMLLEKLRAMYCSQFGLPYEEIDDKTEDFRAARVTSYLNTINELAKRKFDEFRIGMAEKSNELRDFIALLPDGSELKRKFKDFTAEHVDLDGIAAWLDEHMTMGSIDVNIMTKLDKKNFADDGEELPLYYNDAHAALRGYAQSDLTNSSIVLSAGMNPRLYASFEDFGDFFPDENGRVRKKIVLKVSDYRSAAIQGKFLARKGLWVSEYRVESGLNCGGHAFASDGFLMGPILAEFRDRREELFGSLHGMLVKALAKKGRPVPDAMLPVIVTAQGGVGTAEEHSFLLGHYGVDSVGWGTPFLLVEDVTNVDEVTLRQLQNALEEDLYVSRISPLGIAFNSLRGNTKDQEKEEAIKRGRPGSPCPKKYLVSNTEFTDKPICTASRRYQQLKIKELDALDLPPGEYSERYERIVEKACICVGLGTPALLVNGLDTKREGEGVSICPGPNLAYFSRRMTMREMIDHIYGRTNVIDRADRPHMFVKELSIYLDYLGEKIDEAKHSLTDKRQDYFEAFASNLSDGIAYYRELFSGLADTFQDIRATILDDFTAAEQRLDALKTEIATLGSEEKEGA